MLDNFLFALIINLITTQASTAGVPGLLVKQVYQPTKQGSNVAPTAYMFKLFDERVGSPFRQDVWNVENGNFDTVITQQYATHFQISAISQQDPSTPSQYTASDILNACAYILQSDATLAQIQAQGVGVQRITPVRNPSFVDEHGQFAYDPNFELILTHKQIITSPTPQINDFDIGLYEV
jgi:hypothetical protein